MHLRSESDYYPIVITRLLPAWPQCHLLPEKMPDPEKHLPITNDIHESSKANYSDVKLSPLFYTEIHVVFTLVWKSKKKKYANDKIVMLYCKYSLVHIVCAARSLVWVVLKRQLILRVWVLATFPISSVTIFLNLHHQYSQNWIS